MSDTSLQPPQAAQRHLPWWMLVVSLTAIVALYAQRPGEYPSLQTPVLGLLIASAYVIRARIPDTGVLRWIIRGTLFMIILMIGPDQQRARVGMFFFTDPVTMHLLGSLLAAELLVQHYLPDTFRWRRGGIMIVATGVMTCATATSATNIIAVLAPIYTLAIFGVLRSLDPLPSASPAATLSAPARTSRRWALHGTALVLAMTIGFFGIGLFQAYQNGLSSVTNNLLNKLGNLSVHYTGMSDNEHLGDQLNLTPTTSRVLRLRGTNRVMYLRGMAFDEYNHSTWLPRLAHRQLGPVPADLLLQPSAPAFSVERLDDGLEVLYLPVHTTGFRITQPAKTEVEPGHRSVIRCTPDKDPRLTYFVGLPAGEEAQGPLCRPLTAQERTACLTVPSEIEPEVRTIAESLKQDSPRKTIAALIARLHQDHSYSLKVDAANGDAISSFVAHQVPKNAHCQYFASAITMLLRCDGIPARYVTGYVAHETAGANSMIVRSSDAHAWCEAWVDGVGWITVEATPAGGTPDKANTKISLWQKIREYFSDLFSSVADFFRSLQWYQIAIAGAALTIIAVGAQILQSRREKRKRPIVRTYTFPSEDYRRIALEFERLLREMGDIPPGAATWSEHLRHENNQTSGRRKGKRLKLDAARRFIDAYNQTRFGNPHDPKALAELDRLLDEIKRD